MTDSSPAPVSPEKGWCNEARRIIALAPNDATESNAGENQAAVEAATAAAEAAAEAEAAAAAAAAERAQKQARSTELSAQLDEARQRVAQLRTHALVTEITQELGGLDGLIAATDAQIQGEEFEPAAAGLTRLEADSEAAATVLREHEAFAAALTAAEQRVAALVQEAIRPEADQIRVAQIEPAKTAAAARDYSTAMARLAEVEGRCEAAVAIAAQHAIYAAARTTAEEQVAALGRHARAEVVTEDIARIRTSLLEPAQARAVAREYPAAAELLGRVEAECLAATLVADRDATYQAALQVATGRIAPLTQDVIRTDVEKVQLEQFAAAATAVATRDYTTAMARLAEVEGKCVAALAVVALHDEFAAALQTTEARVAAITHALVAPAIAAIKSDKIEPAKAKASVVGGRDYGAAKALLTEALALCPPLEVRVDRYTRALGVATARHTSLKATVDAWSTWYPLPGIEGEPEQIKLANLDAAETAATAADFDRAMSLLEAVPTVSAVVWKKLGVMNQIYEAKAAADQALTESQALVAAFTDPGTTAGLLGPLQAAHIDIMWDPLGPGNYDAVLAVLAPFEANHAVALATIQQHKQYEADLTTAKTRIATLSQPSIATDKAKIEEVRITAADTAMRAAKYDEALALLGKVDAEVTAIEAYRVALEAANTAVETLSQPAVTSDKTRISTHFIAAAKTRATARDYAGAKALLDRVPAEVAAVAASQAGETQAKLALTGAEAAVGNFDDSADAALSAVEAQLALLKTHGGKDAIVEECGLIDTAIAGAKVTLAGETPGPAKAVLEKALADCEVARQKAVRWVQFEAAFQPAVAKHTALPATVLAADKTKLETDYLKKAEQEAKAGNVDAALQTLIPFGEACAEAIAIGELDAKYKIARTAAVAAIAAIGEPDKTRIDTDCIQAATAKAATRDYEDALALLAKVQPECDEIPIVAAAKASYDAKLLNVGPKWTALEAEVTTCEGYNPPVPASIRPEVNSVKADLIDKAVPLTAAKKYAEAEALLQQADDRMDKAQFEVDSYRSSFGYYADTEKNIQDLEKHAGLALVAAETAQFKATFQGVVQLRDTADYKAASGVLYDIYWGSEAAKARADEYATHLTRLATAKAEVAQCEQLVGQLTPAVPLITAKLTEIKTQKVDAAELRAEAREPKVAQKLLAEVEPACLAVQQLVTKQKAYKDETAAVAIEIAKLDQPIVAADKARITAQRVEPAETAAATLDFATAMALLTKARAECTSALAIQTQQVTDEAARAAAQLLIDQLGTDGGQPAQALQAVRDLLTELTSHPAHVQMATKIQAIQRLVTAAAADGTAPAVAQSKLTEAAAACVETRALADRCQNFTTAIAAAKGRLTPLSQDLIATDIAKIKTDRIEAAATKAKAPGFDFAGAFALLEGVEAACAAAKAIVDAHAEYEVALAAAEAQIAGPWDAELQPDVATVKTDRVEAAKTKIAPPTRDYAGAMTLLGKVKKECRLIALKKDPSKAKFDALMAEPGGEAMLDDYVKSLPASTKRSVVAEAMEARFGVKLALFVDDDSPADLDAADLVKSPQAIYEMMTQVPASHVQNNPSLKLIRSFSGGDADKDEARGSYYWGDGSMTLSCGRAEDDWKHPLDDVTTALPDVEPGCELIPDSAESPAPQYFNWTTFHEIGHAIDDKKSFMNGKAGNSSFGGWQTHGRDVTPLAKAAASEFNYDENYILCYLLKQTPPPPAAPTGRADWDACRTKAEKWCDAIRVGKEVWERGSESKARAIGGRVYHEAYAGSWVSYETAARSKGITGYQFRAPGEWISELYAAYFAKKLPASHPAYSWLDTL